MKVLFLTTWYPTTTQPNFGVFVKEHAKAIHRQPEVERLTIIALVIHKSNHWWEKNITETQYEQKTKTILIEIKTKFKDLLYHLPYLQYQIFNTAFRLFRSSIEVDIVHSNVVIPTGYIGDRLAKKLNTPHIITEHWSKVRNLKKGTRHYNLARKMYNNTTSILPVSLFLEKIITQRFGISSQKCHIVPNIVDTSTFQFKPKKQDKNSIKLITIAHWEQQNHPTKLPELLIDAIEVLQQDYEKSIEITFVGDGNKLPELKALCQAKNIKSKFVGYANKTSINSLLQASDFLVHCSTIETFGLTVVEALLTGTPVICSSVGALPEKIDTSNGVLVENRLDHWVAALKKGFETNYQHQSISQAIVSKYSYDGIGQSIISQYKKNIVSY